MKRFGLVAAVLFTCSTLVAPAAMAWDDLGHSVVGGIAEQNLEPGTAAWIRGLIGIEPLSVAAIFPDHVRDDQRFGHQVPKGQSKAGDDNNFDDYHFCEIPAGTTYDTKPNKDPKDCYGAIQGSIAILKDSSSSREEKGIALRYLVHVMGDITQPLHVGNGADLGGNLCQIHFKNQPKPVNFHSFWDGQMVFAVGDAVHGKYDGEIVAGLKQAHADLFTEAAKAQYGQGSVKDWLAEAAQIRDSGLYPDDQVTGVVKGQETTTRPYCGSMIAGAAQIDPSQIPNLDQAYISKWEPVTEMQLIKGGLRLAKTLDDIAAQVAAGQPSINDQQQQSILSDVQAKFKGAANK